jgi:RNA polymerase sigma factor (sigma-70 family)
VKSSDPQARRIGWSALVEAYWKPVYKYVRLKWRTDGEEAADLTQEFFARALEKSFFAPFDPARARFRTFLRVCLDAFVANQRQSATRLKRGGGVAPLSLDFAAVDGEFGELRAAAPIAPDDLDRYFHQEWVRALYETALADLRAACEAQGRQNHFELFRRHDLVEVDGANGGGDAGAGKAAQRPSYAELAKEFSLPITTVTNHLAWARRELRERVLARLRALCANEQEFRDEARALLGIAPS